METSLYLASILGPLLFTIGLSLIINPGIYNKMISGISNDALATYVSSLGGFVVGLAMIYSHNVWESNWTVIITLLSWAVFTKSALLLVFPTFFDTIIKKFKFSKGLIQFVGIFYCLIGLFLIGKIYL